MRTDDDDPLVPVALTCALGLVAAGLAVVDTDVRAAQERAAAPSAIVRAVEAPAPGFVRPPPPRRVIVVRRRSRAS